MKREYDHAMWLENAIVRKQCKRAVRLAAATLKSEKFDTIAFSGMSGVLFGSVLAARMNKEMILVRKESDRRHSGRDREGHVTAKRVLIVDDICSSGTTIQRIVKGVNTFAPKAKIIGAYFYGEGAGDSSSPQGFTKMIARYGCVLFQADTAFKE